MKSENRKIENSNSLGKLENCVYPVRSKFKKRKISLLTKLIEAVKSWVGN